MQKYFWAPVSSQWNSRKLDSEMRRCSIPLREQVRGLACKTGPSFPPRGFCTAGRPSFVSTHSLAGCVVLRKFMTVADGGTLALIMPVRVECCSTTGSACPSSACLVPPAPINTHQPGVATSLLYSGSQFRGYQKSKGNSYDVEVVLQVMCYWHGLVQLGIFV